MCIIKLTYVSAIVVSGSCARYKISAVGHLLTLVCIVNPFYDYLGPAIDIRVKYVPYWNH